MAIYFLDSSAIVKHYQAEVGTAEVDRVLMDYARLAVLGWLFLSVGGLLK